MPDNHLEEICRGHLLKADKFSGDPTELSPQDFNVLRQAYGFPKECAGCMADEKNKQCRHYKPAFIMRPTVYEFEVIDNSPDYTA